MKQKVLIIGAGQGGTSILKMLAKTDSFQVVGVIDLKKDAVGTRLAVSLGISTGTEWEAFLTKDIDIIIEVTGKEDVFRAIRDKRHKRTVLIPGSVAYILARLMEEKEGLIQALRHQSFKQDLIFNSTDDGMIVVDEQARVLYVNKSAQRMVGIREQEVQHQHVLSVIPDSGLPRVLETKRTEANQELVLHNGVKIVTTRTPLIDDRGVLFGAVAVFKDITEVVQLAEQVTNLEEIRTMLQAIIHSSDDAITVVDDKGNGLLINPAYTRITGLSEKDVVGKPATIDISEGESVHLKVLQTRKPMRGVRMKVGPRRREVIVNVAPIIVGGILKGSVGVIHDMSEIQSLTTELHRARRIIRSLEAKYTFEDIIGEAEEMVLAIEQAKLAARTPATILLRGESGTGKELFAHAIHNASERKYNKFIRVNCAAIHEHLLESELFGYEEGAFTGASRGGKKGFFEEADKGTILLDEIGELPLHTQAKLLRVLQEKEIVRVGGTKPISVDVRVISATNVNLEKEMSAGRFREDLYYRLSRMPIHIPPLKKRKEDLPALVLRLVEKLNQDYGRNVEEVEPAVLEQLRAYDWPGNVRELENIIGRAMIFMEFHEQKLSLCHLPTLMPRLSKASPINQYTEAQEDTLANRVRAYETQCILSAISSHNGNKTEAAKSLGISVRTLYNKLEK